MNKEAIQKVINTIKRAKPERVVMNSILTDYVVDDKGKIMNCGTAGCIAGWTLIAHKIDDDGRGISFGTAGEILGLDRVKYYQLFMMDRPGISIPIMNLGDFDRGYTAKQRKKMVIRVLELLRDTGKVQWERVLKEQENADRDR